MKIYSIGIEVKSRGYLLASPLSIMKCQNVQKREYRHLNLLNQKDIAALENAIYLFEKDFSVAGQSST